MYVNNLGDALTQIAIAPVASVSSTSNATGVDLTGAPTNSTAVNTGNTNYEGEIAFLLDAANTAGSTPTLAIKLQDSADNSTFADITGGAFTGLTTVASQQKIVLNKDNLRRYVRAAYTIGGTSSPAYNVSIQAVVAKKNPA